MSRIRAYAKSEPKPYTGIKLKFSDMQLGAIVKEHISDADRFKSRIFKLLDFIHESWIATEDAFPGIADGVMAVSIHLGEVIEDEE